MGIFYRRRVGSNVITETDRYRRRANERAIETETRR
jgi:hypothetical protein